MSGLTATLAAYVAGAQDRDSSEDEVALIALAFADTAAVILAGRDEDVSRIVLERAVAHAPGTSTVLLGRQRASAQAAALVNATAGHALDYDDVAFGGHPSVVIVPAVMAVAEAIGASGMAMIRAYRAGYEVWAELIARDADRHHVKGWHPTGVFGTVAAAAAVAALRRLDEARCAQALSLAASFASGLVANFGSMAKPLHAGRAAAAGIESVELVLAGFTAASDAIEHRAGFLQAISPRGRVNLEPACPRLGEHLREHGLSFKQYPVCYAMHRVIDGAIAIHGKQRVHARDIAEIAIEIGRTQAGMLIDHVPQSALEAKFHLGFVAACGLLDGRLTLAQLAANRFADDDVRATMAKVRVSLDDATSNIDPIFSPADRVRVRLDDGRTLDSGPVVQARGTCRPGALDVDVSGKFEDCVRYGHAAHAARLRALFETLPCVQRFDVALGELT